MALDEIGLSVTLRAELDRFEANMRQAGKVVEASTGTMDRATKRAGDQFARLEGKLDPAAKALQRYERDTLKVKAALDKNAVSTERATALQAKLNSQYEANIARLGGMGNAVSVGTQRLSAATSGQRNYGLAVQNSAYQIGDFAVQVASGTSATRALAQQLPQLLGGFGVMGAVIGAVVAIGGALAPMLMDTAESADEAKKAFDNYLKTLEATNKITEEGIQSSKDLGLQSLRAAEAANASARAKANEAEQTLNLLEAEANLSDLRGNTASRAGAFYQGRAADLRRQIESAREDLNGFLGEVDASQSAIDTLREKITNASTATADGIRKEVEANSELAAALKVSQHEYDVTKKTLELLADKGFHGTREEARSLAETLVTSEERLRKLTDAQNDNAKSADQLAKKQENLRKAFQNFIGTQETKNESLQRELSGQKELNPLLEAEAQWRQKLGRELLPDEESALERVFGIQRDLTDQVKKKQEAEKEAQKQAKETERIWTNAADNIQNALADSIFAGKDLFESLKDTALSVAKQIAAAMIFQPIISPIIGSVSGGMAGTPMSGGLLGNLGGGSGGMFSGLSSVWDMLNGPSTMGNSFVTGSIGQMLGLSTPAASGIGPVAVSGLGQSLAGIGNFLGAGGMGYGVGSLVGALGIGNSTGASIGGALGGAVGSIIPGVGTIIGSVAGSLIGSLFGNNQPSDKFAQTYIGLRSGQTSQAFNPSEFSQQNLDASQALITQVQSLTDQITSLTGGTLPEAAFAKVGSRDGIVVGVGSSGINVNNRGAGITQSFANSEQGAQNALDFLATAISRRVSGVSDPMYRQVLALGGTASEISSNLQFVEQIKQLAEGGKTQTLADSLQAVNVKYAEAITRAKSLGLSINEIVTAREREKQAIKDQVQAQRDSFGLNLDYRSAQLAGNDRLALEIQLEEQRKQQIANAQSLLDQQIITQTQFQRLSDILDQEVIKSLQSFDDQLNQSATQLATSALSNLQQFATGLATSDLSPLNAQQQGAYAQTEFSRLAGLAQGGDITAINQLSGAAQTYLQTQRTLYGSGTQFVDAFNAVTSVLSQIANTDTNTLIEQAITVETRNQTETLAAKLDEVKSVLQSILNQNQTASNKPAQAA